MKSTVTNPTGRVFGPVIKPGGETFSPCRPSKKHELIVFALSHLSILFVIYSSYKILYTPFRLVKEVVLDSDTVSKA